MVTAGMLTTLAGQGIAQDRLTAQQTARPQVSIDFPGGAAEVLNFDRESGELHIHPGNRDDRGWPCWWYFRLDGLTPGQKLTLKVSPHPRPYRGDTRLSGDWSQPKRAALSVDRVTWSQTPPCRMQDGVAIYELEVPAERIWMAWGPPFLPAQTEDLFERIVKKLPTAERFELARTRGNQPVSAIRIGAAEVEPTRFAVWVQARQHAWEAGSSWVAQGFLEWVASDDPAAVELRRTTAVYVVPIMDVDNVLLGAGGKDAVPRDHNRDWTDKPIYPEVAAAQRIIQELHDAGKLRLYLDLHNPGAGNRRPYFYAPAHLQQLPSKQQDNYTRWLATCVATIRGPLAIDPNYKFATYIQTDEERRRMSKEWVFEHTSPRVLSLTLETAWNTPDSNQEGYRIVGRQLAEATARYLSRWASAEAEER